MSFQRLLSTVVVLLALAACSTNQVNLTYAPSRTAGVAPPSATAIAIGRVLDERPNPPKELGAIRGGFGNPLKTLETPEPVAVMVSNAFTSGLRTRGWLAQGGKSDYSLNVIVRRMDCSQYVRREAHAHFVVSAIDQKTGSQVFEGVFQSDVVSGSKLAVDVGLFAEVDDLLKVANQALSETVDKALDDARLGQRLGVAR
jgi:uncharacterized lipoprotein YajG